MNISLMEPIGVPEEMIDSLAERLKKEVLLLVQRRDMQ